MANHDRIETLSRKQRRREKYQPDHQRLADLLDELHRADQPRLMSWHDRVITVQEGAQS